MNWLNKIISVSEKIKTNLKKRFPTKSELADSKWFPLDCCNQNPILKTELEEELYVCPHCKHHKRISCKQRYDYFFGKNNYTMLDYPTPKQDPIQFPGYKEKLKAAIKKTGQKSAFEICTGKINDINITAISSNFGFLGGSMGRHESEAFLTAIQFALDNRQPVVNFTTGGGIRVYENLIGLAQMTRTTIAINELKKNNLPYINVICDPTAGGQAASYAMQGDYNMAEPGATIAFAGARVIKSTVNEDLPQGFQKSEYVLESGFLDAIVQRSEIKNKISSLLSILLHKHPEAKENLTNESSELSFENKEAS